MNFGELKQRLIDEIGRTDITDSLASSFVSQAQLFLERELQLNEQKKVADLTVTSGKAAKPSDYVLVSYLLLGDNVLDRLDSYREVVSFRKSLYEPWYFFDIGSEFEIISKPEDNSTVTLEYFASFGPLQNFTDTNLLTDKYWDLLLYQSCSNVARLFNDKRKQDYDAMSNYLLQSVIKRNIEQEMSSSGPMYITTPGNMEGYW